MAPGLADGPLAFGLELFEVAGEELVLLFPVAAEADRVRAEGEVFGVDVARGRDDLSPGVDRLLLVGDGFVERREVAGLLIQVVGDAGQQALRVVLRQGG